MAIGFIPLDSRPVNCSQIHWLGKLGGVKILSPPAQLLDHFLAPASVDGICDWMQREQNNTQGWVVSLDMIAFGGLIASRKEGGDLDEAKRRWEILSTLKQRRQRVPIYAYSIITRLSITVSDRGTERIWAEIFNALSLGAEPVFTDPEGKQAWERYVRVRARNHQLNLEAVNLAARGIIDRLILAQEDAAPFGPHVQEQKILKDRINEMGVRDRVSILTGADEIGGLMLARMAAQSAGIEPRVSVFYDNPEAGGFHSLYEDITLDENVKAKISAAGAGMEPRGKSDFTLIVHRTMPEQEDLFLGPMKNLNADNAGSGSAAPNPFDPELFPRSSGVLLADVQYANGGDMIWIDDFLKKFRGAGMPLFAAAWNTTGNTIGSVICAGVLYQSGLNVLDSGEPQSEAWLPYLIIRFLDDWVYQSHVRGELIRELRRIDPEVNLWNLGSGHNAANELLNNKFIETFHREAAELLEVIGVQRSQSRLDWVRGIKVQLPWPRIFEVRIDVPCLPQRR